MVRRLLLLVMALQVLAGVGIAWALARRLPLDMALLAAVALVLGVRLAITANNFRMTRQRQHRLPWPRRLRLVAHEYFATMRTTSWHMLGPRPRPHIVGDAQGLPVLLLHGYGANGGFWSPLAARLRACGVSYATLDLEPVTASIDAYAPLVEQAVRELRAATGAQRVLLLAHSMGGLVARAYLRRYGTAQVARVITLGTPHHGTTLASLGVGENARQMRRGAPWLAQLDADDRAWRALFVSLYSHHDNIIAPQDSCHLPGARNIAVDGVGHVALGCERDVVQRVLAEILAIT